MARLIACRALFDWNFDGTFTDESTRLVRASGESRFAPPHEAVTAAQGMTDSCTLELWNEAGRYSPLNASGALYAWVQSGGAYHVPVRVEIAIDGSTYYRVFTGVTKIPQKTDHH